MNSKTSFLFLLISFTLILLGCVTLNVAAQEETVSADVDDAHALHGTWYEIYVNPFPQEVAVQAATTSGSGESKEKVVTLRTGLSNDAPNDEEVKTVYFSESANRGDGKSKDERAFLKEVGQFMDIFRNKNQGLLTFSPWEWKSFLFSALNFVKPQTDTYEELTKKWGQDTSSVSNEDMAKSKQLLNSLGFSTDMRLFVSSNLATSLDVYSDFETRTDIKVYNTVENYRSSPFFTDGSANLLEFTVNERNDDEKQLQAFTGYTFFWPVTPKTERQLRNFFIEGPLGDEFFFVRLASSLKSLVTEGFRAVELDLRLVDSKKRMEYAKVDPAQYPKAKDLQFYFIQTPDGRMDLSMLTKVRAELSQRTAKDITVIFPGFVIHEKVSFDDGTFQYLLKDNAEDLSFPGSANSGKISSESRTCMDDTGVNGEHFLQWEVGTSVAAKFNVGADTLKAPSIQLPQDADVFLFNHPFYFVITEAATGAPLAITYISKFEQLLDLQKRCTPDFRSQ